MNFKDVAHAIVEKQNDERWMAQRDRIEEALRDAYAAGVTVGSIPHVGDARAAAESIAHALTVNDQLDRYGEWGVTVGLIETGIARYFGSGPRVTHIEVVAAYDTDGGAGVDDVTGVCV